MIFIFRSIYNSVQVIKITSCSCASINSYAMSDKALDIGCAAKKSGLIAYNTNAFLHCMLGNDLLLGGKIVSNWNKEKLGRYINEGRGQGEKSCYIPWTKTHEFSSKGRASRIFGIKTQRIHHFHSDNQLRAFHMYEWVNDNVVDIRECFPLLDVMEVIDDKDNLRFDKFRDKESGEQLVLTTSFLLTIRDSDGKERYLARSIKDSSELIRKITLEKLEIENRYWKAKGIDWKITTDKQLSRQLAKNIEWVRETLLSNEQQDINKDQLSDDLLNHLLINPDSAIRDSLRDFDNKAGVSNGVALYLFRYLIAKKEINIDMRNKIDTAARITDLML